MNARPDNNRIDFLGVPLDLISPDALLAESRSALRGGRRIRLEGLNVAKLVDARTDPLLMNALEEAERVHIDGAGISLGLRLLTIDSPPRRSGIDLLDDLCALAAETGASVYMLGARKDVVELAVQRLLVRHPDLHIAGWRDGYFTAEQEDGVADAIRASAADILFIGISSPKKEMFLHQQWPRIGAKIAMGVGGSFDVLSGKLPRAPEWMQAIAMEWFFRLLMEPRRLLWRYLRTNTQYLTLLAWTVLTRQRRSRPRRDQ